ncbi:MULTISPECIES: MotA/TolQ/ExbB proton channel family protein [Pandoraea]|uniref:MotA/TolQ/ExbB proton channel n=1 Tax=Pandoraea communis TaxID=2508297 RepID=A0A5E4U289_9BURK|nr:MULTISPECIES: MotA/TolQ/ExbB proton channel family protein [Pandoraea]EON15220.1 MotA/TolQ/ExbB proton channel [Pandoraea sp. SD6-2]VVD94286.1 MotA/TolQ/ExbB proton channel [Pandoraea communis]
MNLTQFNQLAMSSGGTLYLMALLAFVGITVIVDRGLRLRRTFRRGQRIVEAVSALPVVDVHDADELRAAAAGLPHGHLLDTYAHNLKRSHDGDMEAAIDEAIYLEVPGIDRGLWVLDTVITVAPLLGLFGTIVGMFHAFDVLGASGGDPTRVTSGVAEALIATACGLAIAMSHLWFFNGMQDTVRQTVHQMDTLKRLLLNRHYVAKQAQEPAGVVLRHERASA